LLIIGVTPALVYSEICEISSSDTTKSNHAKDVASTSSVMIIFFDTCCSVAFSTTTTKPADNTFKPSINS
jgi:hypothetical protein